MTKILFTTSLICISAVILSTPAQAREVDCVNHWVNPTGKMVQCFDGNLNYMEVPAHNLYIASSDTTDITDTNNFLRRRATTVEMIMPNLVGKQIDPAEDYLLGMGVTLGSSTVNAPNKVAGEIIQQTPAPGTMLIKGQTVALQYMGATVEPTQLK